MNLMINKLLLMNMIIKNMKRNHGHPYNGK